MPAIRCHMHHYTTTRPALLQLRPMRPIDLNYVFSVILYDTAQYRRSDPRRGHLK